MGFDKGSAITSIFEETLSKAFRECVRDPTIVKEPLMSPNKPLLLPKGLQKLDFFMH